jgi:alanine dehydrogenase
VLVLADKGYRQALLDDPGLMDGLNIHDGKVCCAAVAEALGYEYVDPRRVLAA